MKFGWLNGIWKDLCREEKGKSPSRKWEQKACSLFTRENGTRRRGIDENDIDEKFITSRLEDFWSVTLEMVAKRDFPNLLIFRHGKEKSAYTWLLQNKRERVTARSWCRMFWSEIYRKYFQKSKPKKRGLAISDETYWLLVPIIVIE